MIIHGNTTYPLPKPLRTITRKSWLKILGVYSVYFGGYSIKKLCIVDIINTMDKKLWDKFLANPSHALHTLLPPKRKLQLRDRGHDYELPNIRTESEFS